MGITENTDGALLLLEVNNNVYGKYGVFFRENLHFLALTETIQSQEIQRLQFVTTMKNKRPSIFSPALHGQSKNERSDLT